MTRIKICGITSQEDAAAAVEAGVDALGFIFFERSPRYVTPEQVKTITSSLPPFVTTTGVFVNEAKEKIHEVVEQCGLHAVQLHGDESPEFCNQLSHTTVKAIRVKDRSWLTTVAPYQVHAVLLDTYTPDRYGGTGQAFDWNLIEDVPQPIILSGGLGPDNIQAAIQCVHPYGVDASSGVEASPGVKDHSKIRAFVQAVQMEDRT